ncbi:MAG TPA: TetR/AcrR family transcriptional regulator [Polyangiaceae bacterium]
MVAATEDTKARLLAEARDSFLEVGLAKFSLREVARRAGVSAAAVYRHFADKEALFHQVCGKSLEIFYSYLVKSLAAKTPRGRIDLCAKQYLAFGLENPRDYRLIFMGDREHYGDHEFKVEDRGPTYQFLMDRVRECMDAGDFRQADVDQTAATIWAHVHGLVSLRLAGQLANLTDAKFAAFYESSTKQLLAGLSK